MYRLIKNNLAHLTLAISLALCSCATSRVGGSGNSGPNGGNTANDVAFNPTTSSDLQIYNYKALRQRFIITFGLSPASATVAALDSKKAAFLGTRYTATFAKEYAAVVAVACGEIPDSVAFPQQKSITKIWKLLTETDPNVDVKEIESSILTETAAETADVTNYGLCFAAFTSPPAVFINYTTTEKPL